MEATAREPDSTRDELLRVARERLRAQLAAEAQSLAADDADGAVIADVQAFLDKLAPEVNTP